MVEGLDVKEVDKGVSDLTNQPSRHTGLATAYIAAIGEIESKVHEVELTGNNLDISEHQAGMGVAYFVQNVEQTLAGELVLVVSSSSDLYS